MGISRRPAYCPNRNDEKLQRFRGKNDWPRSRAVGSIRATILGISPDEAIFVTYSDHRGSKVRLIIFPSKALQFFVIAVPAICRASANSHVQTVKDGPGVAPFYLGVESNLKRTGENGDTVFLAPAATTASSLTAGNAKKCGLMYIVHCTGSFHAHAIPHWNTCRNLRSFLRCSARSAFAHSASA